MGNYTESAPTSQNGVAVSEQTAKTARRRHGMKFWSIVKKARNMFDVQLKKDNETKLMCLGECLSFYPDKEKFWIEYITQVDRLLDSKRFERDCRRLKLLPETVAQHIVFRGNTEMNKALKDGIEIVIGRNIELYVDDFLPNNVVKYSFYFKERQSSKTVDEDV